MHPCEKSTPLLWHGDALAGATLAGFASLQLWIGAPDV